MGATGPDVLDPFLAAPDRAAILCDFDGTLSPIVEHADEAVALPGVRHTLDALSRRYSVVGVISGRPIAYLAAQLPSSVVLSGVYGLETRRDGRVQRHPEAASWTSVVDEVARAAASSPGDVLEVEHKGLSLTLHYRTHPEDEEEVVRWASAAARDSGLLLRAAKMSVELHPPVSRDKGTAVEELAAGAQAVCFLGDDVGDLPAFDALDRLAARGATTLRVAVTTVESVTEVVDRADLRVDGPEGALALLQALLGERR